MTSVDNTASSKVSCRAVTESPTPREGAYTCSSLTCCRQVRAVYGCIRSRRLNTRVHRWQVVPFRLSTVLPVRQEVRQTDRHVSGARCRRTITHIARCTTACTVARTCATLTLPSAAVCVAPCVPSRTPTRAVPMAWGTTCMSLASREYDTLCADVCVQVLHVFDSVDDGRRCGSRATCCRFQSCLPRDVSTLR